MNRRSFLNSLFAGAVTSAALPQIVNFGLRLKSGHTLYLPTRSTIIEHVSGEERVIFGAVFPPQCLRDIKAMSGRRLSIFGTGLPGEITGRYSITSIKEQFGRYMVTARLLPLD